MAHLFDFFNVYLKRVTSSAAVPTWPWNPAAIQGVFFDSGYWPKHAGRVTAPTGHRPRRAR